MHLPHSVVRDGGRIVYYEHGSGETTLVLIRPLGYGAVYQPVVERICEAFRIITIEPRGVGGSDPFTRPYTLSQHAEDVRAVIEASNTDPVVAVGLSRGGGVLTKLAATHPHLFAKIVLVDPHFPAPGSGGKVSNQAMFSDLDNALAAGNLETAISLFVPTVVSEPGTEAIATHMKSIMMGLPPETVLSFFLDREEDANVHKLLPRVSMPALVMHGTQDLRIPIKDSRLIAEHIPGALFFPFQDRGHIPMTTATGEFCEVLRQFIYTGTVPGSES
jgi:pimeloyl-ACP methyl ester carboxylesterase